MGGYEDFKILNYERVRHNRRVDLKLRGGGDNPFQSNFDPLSQKYAASVFQNWFKIHFLLQFHVYCFGNNRDE